MTALARWFCRYFHGRILLPVNGTYRCARCLREFPAWQSKGRITFTITEIPEAQKEQLR